MSAGGIRNTEKHWRMDRQLREEANRIVREPRYPPLHILRDKLEPSISGVNRLIRFELWSGFGHSTRQLYELLLHCQDGAGKDRGGGRGLKGLFCPTVSGALSPP